MFFNEVVEPTSRGRLRQFLGKEYFILQRIIDWLKRRSSFSKVNVEDDSCHFSLIRHQSMLLRPLKDVDMYLQYNKITNLKLAIAHLNGAVIHPGQVFSLWRQVGRPTREKGYLDGLTLHNGIVSKDIGGGLCQLGNLLYWMALHSDLSITERWRHSFDVFPDINRKISFACGATLSYNYIDLQLTNTTDRKYRINLWLDDEYLHGELFSDHPVDNVFEVFETDHQIKQQWWGGYTRHNKIWKRKKNIVNNNITEELVSENHAIMMYNPLLSD